MKSVCEFCTKSVTSSYLLKHQKTGRCLEAQGKHAATTFPCNWCGEVFLRSNNLKRHKSCCKRKGPAVAQSVESQLREENKRLQMELTNALDEITLQQEWIEELQMENTLQLKEISVLKANPRTVVNQTNYIKVDKFVVQQHAKDNFTPLTDSLLKQCLTITVDPRLLLGGPEAVAQLILETSLSGQNKVACTDTSRVVVLWKDIDSSIVTDLKMRKLMPRLVRPIYQPYYASWRSDTNTDVEEYRAIGDVLHRLHMITLKKDTTSKFYNTLASIIIHANCDLSFIMEEDDYCDRADGYMMPDLV